MSSPTRLVALCLLANTAFAVEQNTGAPETDNDQAIMSSPVAVAKPSELQYFQGIKLLQETKPEDQARGRALLKASSDAEFSHAQNYLGICMLRGKFGVKKDTRQAFNLFKLAADHGNAFAQMNLGLCYMQGTGCDKDSEKAIACFESCVSPKADYSAPVPPASPKAAQATNKDNAPIQISGQVAVDEADTVRAAAHNNLGDLLTAANKGALAQEHYVLAATMGVGNRAGLYDACLKAAINYAFAQGVPRDMKRADELLTLSKKLLHRVGLSYVHSLVEQKMVEDFDVEELETRLTKQTEQIQTKVQTEIAGSFADPKSKNYDAKEAVKWYELAAESGDAWAMLNLAFMYHEGRLGQPEPAKAFEWFKKASEKSRHRLGTANYSICLENGIGTERDHTKALEIWKDNEHDDIVSLLGLKGLCPKTILTYEQRTELTHVWAEKNKDPNAQKLWSEHWFNGWGVEEDFDKGLKWLRKAAEAGQPEALCDLGDLYQTEPRRLGIRDSKESLKQAIALYTKASERGNLSASANLGHMYHNGIGCEKDDDKSLEYYQKCLVIKPDFSRALNGIGVIYEYRAKAAKSLNNNIESAECAQQMFESYTKAAALKDAYANYNLGTIAYEGTLQKMDKQAAFSYFDAAANAGYPAKRVHYKMGLMLETGDGMPISLREAAYHYRIAALDNSADALYKLCQLYTRSEGFTQDWDRAINWLTLLAGRGDPDAVADIGDALIHKGDFGNAFTLFKQMRSDRDPVRAGIANERLSQFYRDGTGVKLNAEKAEKYFQQALALGNRDAQFRRSEELLKQGKNKEGFDFLNKAAKQGLPEAIIKVAMLSIKGEGVPRNEKFGYSCLRNVANAGSSKAMLLLIEGTLQKNPHAPTLAEALHYAERMQACEHPRAAELLRQLEAKEEQKS